MAARLFFATSTVACAGRLKSLHYFKQHFRYERRCSARACAAPDCWLALVAEIWWLRAAAPYVSASFTFGLNTKACVLVLHAFPTWSPSHNAYRTLLLNGWRGRAVAADITRPRSVSGGPMPFAECCRLPLESFSSSCRPGLRRLISFAHGCVYLSPSGPRCRDAIVGSDQLCRGLFRRAPLRGRASFELSQDHTRA